MKEFVHEEDFHRITSRHVARCLSQLQGISMPKIVTETIKRELWYLSNDLRDTVMKEQGDQNDYPKTHQKDHRK